jgi:hypothetical protein
MSARPGAAELAQTSEEAAKWFKVDPRTFRRWKRAEWFPRAAITPAGIDVEAIQAARPPEAETSSLTQLRCRLLEEQARQKKAEADKAELEVALKERDLIPRDALERLIAFSAKEFSEGLVNLGFILAMDIPKKYRPGLEAKAKAETSQLLRDWCDRLQAYLRGIDEQRAQLEG